MTEPVRPDASDRRERSGRSTGQRLPRPVIVAGWALALGGVALGAFFPIRVSFGAGSLRCPSPWDPGFAEALEGACRGAGTGRLRDVALAFGAFVVASGIAAVRTRSVVARLGATVLVALLWGFGLLMAVAITAAHAAPCWMTFLGC